MPDICETARAEVDRLRETKLRIPALASMALARWQETEALAARYGDGFDLERYLWDLVEAQQAYADAAGLSFDEEDVSRSLMDAFVLMTTGMAMHVVEARRVYVEALRGQPVVTIWD